MSAGDNDEKGDFLTEYIEEIEQIIAEIDDFIEETPKPLPSGKGEGSVSANSVARLEILGAKLRVRASEFEQHMSTAEDDTD